MFGRSKPVVFDPYRRQRARWRLPPWLMLLLAGVAAGAGGLLYLQQRVLPPRLSAGESAALREAWATADAHARRLQAELATAQQQRDGARAEARRASTELAGTRAAVADLQADMDGLVATLPADPRDHRVEVRAARFEAAAGRLDYDVVLTRAARGGKPLVGVLQLSVAGEGARGGEASISAKPVPVSVGSHEVVRGQVSLPEGFTPRQTTVQVLDREGGQALLGMRVMRVR